MTPSVSALGERVELIHSVVLKKSKTTKTCWLNPASLAWLVAARLDNAEVITSGHDRPFAWPLVPRSSRTSLHTDISISTLEPIRVLVVFSCLLSRCCVVTSSHIYQRIRAFPAPAKPRHRHRPLSRAAETTHSAPSQTTPDAVNHHRAQHTLLLLDTSLSPPSTTSRPTSPACLARCGSSAR